MRTPRIIFVLCLIPFAVKSNKASDDTHPLAMEIKANFSRAGGATTEVNEREKRLVPFATYYISNGRNNNSNNDDDDDDDGGGGGDDDDNDNNNNSGEYRNTPLPLARISEHQVLGSQAQSRSNIVGHRGSQHVNVYPSSLIQLKNPTHSAPSLAVPVPNSPARANVQIFQQLYQPINTPRPGVEKTNQHSTDSKQPIKISPAPTKETFTGPHIIKIIPFVPWSQFQSRVTADSKQTSRPNYSFFNYHNNNNNNNNNLGLVGVNAQNETTADATASIFYRQGVNSSKKPQDVKSFLFIEPGQFNPESTASIRIPTLNINNNLGRDKFRSEAEINQDKRHYSKESNSISQNQVKQQEVVYGQLPRLRVPQESEIRFVVDVQSLPSVNDQSINVLPTLKPVQSNGNNSPALQGFLSVLKETNKLPQNLTPENIDNGIQTLALILNRLQQEKQIPFKGIKTSHTPLVPTSPYSTLPTNARNKQHGVGKTKKTQSFPQTSGTSTPGKPGIDYPIYSTIPRTRFDCSTQRYKGFFGDPETKCQVWHYCDLNGGQASFLCPNGTIFSQVALTCDWWFNVKCASTSQLYVLNERLYKYILPFSPSFPEDYSGPVVDRYLTAKFNEMERKSKTKALKTVMSSTTPTTPVTADSDPIETPLTQ